MTDYPTNYTGWLWIYTGSTYMKLYVEDVEGNWHFNPTIKHYAGGGHMGYDMQKKWWTWHCVGVWAKTAADLATIMGYLNTWQNAGTFTVKFVKDGSSNGIAWDGSNTTYTVMIAKDGVRQVKKVSPGDVQYYRIGMLILEQCG